MARHRHTTDCLDTLGVRSGLKGVSQRLELAGADQRAGQVQEGLEDVGAVVRQAGSAPTLTGSRAARRQALDHHRDTVQGPRRSRTPGPGRPPAAPARSPPVGRRLPWGSGRSARGSATPLRCVARRAERAAAAQQLCSAKPQEPPRASRTALVQRPATQGLVVGAVAGIPRWHARGSGVQIPSAPPGISHLPHPL
jgi:hypothetical protein